MEAKTNINKLIDIVNLSIYETSKLTGTSCEDITDTKDSLFMFVINHIYSNNNRAVNLVQSIDEMREVIYVCENVLVDRIRLLGLVAGYVNK